jgi:threonine dehydratase
MLPLRKVVRPTVIIEAPRLSRRLGIDITLASETFQRSGSFKFRAAYNVAAGVSQKRIIAASSGNFGQALALACQMLGKACCIVMPSTSAQVKIEAVREAGGEVDLIDVRTQSRQERVKELAKTHPDAYVASAYDDPLVIDGNASLGEELGRWERHFDVVIAPVGGGGLTAGLVKGLRSTGSPARVWGAEPLLGNDAALSFRQGRMVANESEPQTIADGARTLSLGQHNWAVLREGLAGIVEVSEERIKEAVRLLFVLANLKAEPTGALGLGAVLAQPELFGNQSVCCVVSGGNVDPEVFAKLL